MSYLNVNKFIVIQADDRDPYVSWQNHLERGSAGGVDCVARKGTPIYAPADCDIVNTRNNGTGGNTVTMWFEDGWRDQFMHLDRFVIEGEKKQGELVGYSGDSGSPGQPHVHWHRIDMHGKRHNPWDYFTSSTSGGTGRPLEGDDDMPFMTQRQDTGGTYLHEGEIITHVAHDDVVKVLNYLGIKGGLGINQVSHDDFRRHIESRGFSMAVVDSLPPGQGFNRITGSSFYAGELPW